MISLAFKYSYCYAWFLLHPLLFYFEMSLSRNQWNRKNKFGSSWYHSNLSLLPQNPVDSCTSCGLNIRKLERPNAMKARAEMHSSKAMLV